MDIPDGLTDYQKVALVRAATGFLPRLQPYDQLLRVVITDTRCGLQVRRFTITERATETRLDHPRIITQAWDLDPTVKVWQFTGSIAIDDPDGKPVIISHRGGKTLEEWTDRLYWEAMCYRPGNGSRFGQIDYDVVQRQTDRAWMRVAGSAPLVDPATHKVYER